VLMCIACCSGDRKVLNESELENSVSNPASDTSNEGTPDSINGSDPNGDSSGQDLPQGPVAKVMPLPLPDRCDSLVPVTDLPRLTVPVGLQLNRIPWHYRIDVKELPETDFFIDLSYSWHSASAIRTIDNISYTRLEGGDIEISFAGMDDKYTLGIADSASDYSDYDSKFRFRLTTKDKSLRETIFSEPFRLIGDSEVFRFSAESSLLRVPIRFNDRLVDPDAMMLSRCDGVLSGTDATVLNDNYFVVPQSVSISVSNTSAINVNGLPGIIQPFDSLIAALPQNVGPRFIFDATPEIATIMSLGIPSNFISYDPPGSFNQDYPPHIIGRLLSRALVDDDPVSVVNRLAAMDWVKASSFVLLPVAHVTLETSADRLHWRTTCRGYEVVDTVNVTEHFYEFTVAPLQDESTMSCMDLGPFSSEERDIVSRFL